MSTWYTIGIEYRDDTKFVNYRTVQTSLVSSTNSVCTNITKTIRKQFFSQLVITIVFILDGNSEIGAHL